MISKHNKFGVRHRRRKRKVPNHVISTSQNTNPVDLSENPYLKRIGTSFSSKSKFNEPSTRRKSRYILQKENRSISPTFFASDMKLVNLRMYNEQVLNNVSCRICFGQVHCMGEDETSIKGLQSTIKFKCLTCGNLFDTPTSLNGRVPLKYTGNTRKVLQPMINLQVVKGCHESGIGMREANRLFTNIGLQSIKQKTWDRQRNVLGNAVDEQFQNSIEYWRQIEIDKTRKSGDFEECYKKIEEEEKRDKPFNFDENLDQTLPFIPTIPQISTSGDGSWTKNKKSMDSATGQASLVGKYTQKVVDSRIFSKDCAKCDYYAKHGITGLKAKHECYKIYEGSSGGMEGEAYVQMLSESRSQHVPYESPILCLDYDTNSRKLIDEKVPYPVKTPAERNHTIKGARKPIEKLAKKFPDLKQQLLKIQDYLKLIILQNQNDEVNMEKDLRSLDRHLFGDHSFCNPKWCKSHNLTKEEDLKKKHHLRFTGADLQYAIKNQVIAAFIDKKGELANMMSTNSNERMHNSILFVCYKHKHHGKSRGYKVKFKIGICRFNDGWRVSIDLDVILDIPESQVNMAGKKKLIRSEDYRKSYIRQDNNKKQQYINKKVRKNKNKSIGRNTGCYESGYGLSEFDDIKPDFENDTSLIFPDFVVNDLNEEFKVFSDDNKHEMSKHELDFLKRISSGDTETTGFRKTDTICDFSFQPLFRSEALQTFVDPMKYVQPNKWTHDAMSLHNLNPESPKIRLAPNVDDFNREYFDRLSEFSGPKPILYFKNKPFDERMIKRAKLPESANNVKFFEAEKLLIPVPTTVLPSKNMDQDNLYRFYINNMEEDSGQHNAKPDTEQLSKLMLKNVGSLKNLVRITQVYEDQIDSAISCSCSKDGSGCLQCVCKKNGKKCGPMCSCRGRCCRGASPMKLLEKNQLAIELEATNNYNQIIRKKKHLKFTGFKKPKKTPKKSNNKKPKTPKAPKKRRKRKKKTPKRIKTPKPKSSTKKKKPIPIKKIKTKILKELPKRILRNRTKKRSRSYQNVIDSEKENNRHCKKMKIT